jgi:hypothetical protein
LPPTRPKNGNSPARIPPIRLSPDAFRASTGRLDRLASSGHGHEGQTIVASIGLLHADEAVFPNARRFDPDRFLSRPPDPAEWIPYGGGIRRCIGAAFATMEMRVVLRTLLRNYVISPSSARDERWQSRGVAVAPSRGARVRIQPGQGSVAVIG